MAIKMLQDNCFIKRDLIVSECQYIYILYFVNSIKHAEKWGVRILIETY